MVFSISIETGRNQLILRGFADNEQIAMVAVRKNRDVFELFDLEQKPGKYARLFKSSAYGLYGFEREFLWELFIAAVGWGKKVGCKRFRLARGFFKEKKWHFRRKLKSYMGMIDIARTYGFITGKGPLTWLQFSNLPEQLNLKQLNLIARQISKIKIRVKKQARVKIWKPKKPRK